MLEADARCYGGMLNDGEEGWSDRYAEVMEMILVRIGKGGR